MDLAIAKHQRSQVLSYYARKETLPSSWGFQTILENVWRAYQP